MDYQLTLQSLNKQYQNILNCELYENQSQFQFYLSRFPDLKNKYQKARPKKPHILTIPEIFRRSYDENFISDYLAFIIDPERNGVGVAPLKAVLAACGIDYDEKYLEKALIHREYSLGNGRIDLLIECGDDFLVGIENKIFSPEGDNQTTYYSQKMVELFSEVSYHLIFLTREGKQAISNEFIPISYSKLLSALRNIPVDNTIEPRAHFFWNDFLEHLEVYIMAKNPDQFEFSDKAILYLDNYAMIDDLTTTFRREWDQVIAFLERRLINHLSENQWKTVFLPRSNYQQVFKPHWNTGKVFIHFEWWLSPMSFLKNELAFGVDVEGPQAKDVFTLYESTSQIFKSQSDRKGIACRPKNRKIAVAYKRYKIERDIKDISDKFLESFDEFLFIEEIIEDILKQLPK
jgi:hypothetical protein